MRKAKQRTVFGRRIICADGKRWMIEMRATEIRVRKLHGPFESRNWHTETFARVISRLIAQSSFNFQSE